MQPNSHSQPPARQRVLLLISELGFGGAERSLIRLANALSAYHDVKVVAFSGNYVEGISALRETLAQVPMLCLDDDKSHVPQMLRWMRRWVRLRRLKQQHDVCISFLTGPNLLNAISGYRGKTIVSQRGTILYDANAKNHHPWLNRHLLIPLTLRLAHVNVCVNAGLKQVETAIFGGAKAVAKSVVIPPFLSPAAMIAHAESPLPDAFIALKGQPLIVAAGRLSIEKNMHHLISMYHALCQRRSDAKLLLVGSGPQQQSLQAQVQACGLALNDMTPNVPSVIFAGYQQNPLPFMRASRVFAFPSGAEGIPNIVLEALSAQCLIVAADAAWGARCVLQQDSVISRNPFPTLAPEYADYGVLMPRADDPSFLPLWTQALDDALNGAFDAKGYRERARERLDAFAEGIIVPKWLEVIQRCTSQGKSSS